MVEEPPPTYLLRGGVLFGVAYAGGYARIFSPAGLKSASRQLWCKFSSRYWPFDASFLFVLDHFGLLCLISFHFGILWLHFLSFWPMAGAISCLREGYAALTRGDLVASDKRHSQLQGHQILQESRFQWFDQETKKATGVIGLFAANLWPTFLTSTAAETAVVRRGNIRNAAACFANAKHISGTSSKANRSAFRRSLLRLDTAVHRMVDARPGKIFPWSTLSACIPLRIKLKGMPCFC